MSQPRTCTRCGMPGLTAACPQCSAAWEARRDAYTMSPEERLEEFRSWTGVLEVDWPKVHQRIEELVGRPVWTHELGTSGIPSLEHEIMTGTHVDMADVLTKLPPDTPIVVVSGREREYNPSEHVIDTYFDEDSDDWGVICYADGCRLTDCGYGSEAEAKATSIGAHAEAGYEAVIAGSSIEGSE